MHSILIRRYEDKDFNDYVDTLRRTWNLEKPRAEKFLREALEDLRKNEEIWVAEVDNRRVGFIMMGIGTEARWERFTKDSIDIQWLDVHPDYQRKGIGTSLIRKIEEIARDKKLSRLHLCTSVTNQKMIKFSIKNEFKIVMRLPDFYRKIGGGDAFLLVKELREE